LVIHLSDGLHLRRLRRFTCVHPATLSLARSVGPDHDARLAAVARRLLLGERVASPLVTVVDDGTLVFDKLNEVPQWLGQSTWGRNSNLLNLFQPQTGTSGLFRVALAFLVKPWWRRLLKVIQAIWLDLLVGIVPGVLVAFLTMNKYPKAGIALGSLVAMRLVRFDTRRAGKLTWPADDNDVYKRRLVKGHRYSVTVDGSRGSDLDLWVWRPGTKDIFQFTIGCFRKGGSCPALAAASASPSADEHAVFRATKTGTYYFQVNSWYSHGRYTLRVKRA
jgi:hypothetical protein